MIKDLICNENAKIRSINKDELVQKLKRMFHKYDIMFVYFGGSISYKTFNPRNSDIDVVVFLKGFDGFIHTDFEQYDLFIFGENCIKLREEVSDELHDYERIFIDDIYALDKTLIYLNEKYEDEYEAFKSFKVDSVMKKYLKHVYDYFMYIYVENEIPAKRFYHVIRIKGQLEHFKDTGVYNLDMDENYRALMLEFKNNYGKSRGKEIYANEISNYLEDFRKYVEEEE